MSLQDAAKHWGLSRQRVHQICYDIVVGSNRRRIHDEAIIAFATSFAARGLSPLGIAESIGFSPYTVRKVLKRHGIVPLDPFREDILRRISAGESVSDIAVATGTSPSNVRRIKFSKPTNRHRFTPTTGTGTRTGARYQRRTTERDEGIWREYNEGKTIVSLAQSYSLSTARIYQILSYERAKAIVQILSAPESRSVPESGDGHGHVAGRIQGAVAPEEKS